jgi:putative component of toxin-antitoxin plasmid stabilization module
MNTILRTAQFAEWLQHLADVKGKARILARITAAEYGNFGDVKPIAGGDKGSQRRDIAKALNLAKTAKE